MKKPIFRADEVLEMAVQVEKQGLAFYKACRNAGLKVRGVVAVLDYLIAQENRHKAVFQRLKSELQKPEAKGYELPESYAGELHSYMNSFVKDRVFSQGDAAVGEFAGSKDFDQAIDLGIRFEKNSMAFYRSLKPVVRISEQESIEAVIGEEEEHIRRLQALKRSMKNDRG